MSDNELVTLPHAGSIWKHSITQRHYIVTGHCRLEASWEYGVICLPIDGPVRRPILPIVREAKIFMDGRFEIVDRGDGVSP